MSLPTASTAFNGERLGAFPLRPRTRQEHPLSPFRPALSWKFQPGHSDKKRKALRLQMKKQDYLFFQVTNVHRKS